MTAGCMMVGPDYEPPKLDVKKDWLEARHRIAELTGLTGSPTAIRSFMKRCGLKRLKSGVLPGTVQPEVQEEFKKHTWSPV